MKLAPQYVKLAQHYMKFTNDETYFYFLDTWDIVYTIVIFVTMLIL